MKPLGHYLISAPGRILKYTLQGLRKSWLRKKIHPMHVDPPFHLDQWFPNVLASDPKEKLDICPGPKLVKTADLQAHNAPLRVAL